MESIDTVIFDLGDVLIPWNPRSLYRKLFSDAVEMERFLAEVCTLEWNAQQDAGRPRAEGTALLVAQFPQHEALIRAYYDRWEEMLGEVIQGTADLLLALKAKGYRVFALSNWSAETFPVARPRYPILEAFDGLVISGREGLIKPDPAIYRLLCERHAIDPRRAVFIDDNVVNVEAARGVGMKAIPFQDAEQVHRDLASLGIRI
jgi:2-haloacid dehalogenase